MINSGDFNKVPWIAGSTSQEIAAIVACEYWALACCKFSFGSIKPTEITSWRFCWRLKFPGMSPLSICAQWLTFGCIVRSLITTRPTAQDLGGGVNFWYLIYTYTQDRTVPPKSAAHEELKVSILHRVRKRGLIFIYSTDLSWRLGTTILQIVSEYRGADKSLARLTSRCILFDG